MSIEEPRILNSEAETSVADGHLLRVAKETSGVITSRAAGTLIGLASNVIFARVLGADLLGVLVLATTTLLFVSLLASVGMGHTFVRFIPVRISRGDDAGAAHVFRLGTAAVTVVSAGVGVALFALRGVLAGPIFKEPLLLPLIPIVSIGSVAATLQLVLGLTLRALKKTAQEAFCIEIVNKVSKLGVFLALAWLGLKLEGATIALVASYYITTAAMLLLVARQMPPLFRGPSTVSVPRREIIAFSGIALFIGFMNYSLSISDRVMLGMLGTSADVGIYNTAFLISNTLALVFMGFNASFAPVISELYHNDRSPELRSLYSSLTRQILIIIVPAFCWIVGFGDDLLNVFGREFVGGYMSLVVLSVSVLVRCVVGTVGTMLVMSGHQKFNAANIVAVTTMNIFLNLLLIPRYGLLGAAVATAVSVSIIDAVGLVEVRLLLKIHPYKRSFLKIAAASLVALLGNLLLRWNTPELSVVPVVGVLVATYGVFAGVMALLGIEREDRLIFERAIAKFRHQS